MRYYMVSNDSDFKNFRAAVSEILILDEKRIALPDEVATALELKVGDPLRYVPVRPWSKLRRLFLSTVNGFQ